MLEYCIEKDLPSACIYGFPMQHLSASVLVRFACSLMIFVYAIRSQMEKYSRLVSRLRTKFPVLVRQHSARV